MKKLLIAILFVLVTVSGFCAGTTTETSGKNLTVNSITTTSATGSHLLTAYQSGSFNLETASVTRVIFETVTLDVGDCYDETTGVFTAPKTGYYLFSAHNTTQNSAGGGFASMFVRVASGPRDVLRDVEPILTNSYTFLSCVGIVKLTAGETVSCFQEQYSGGTIISYGGETGTHISIHLLP